MKKILDYMFEVGDEVESIVCPGMGGTVLKVFGGTKNMLVRCADGGDGTRVLADPNYWRLLKKKENEHV